MMPRLRVVSGTVDEFTGCVIEGDVLGGGVNADTKISGP
jgi:hypothetical protein